MLARLVAAAATCQKNGNIITMTADKIFLMMLHLSIFISSAF